MADFSVALIALLSQTVENIAFRELRANLPGISSWNTKI